MNLKEEWAKLNEEKIEKVNQEVYGGAMPFQYRQTMRNQLKREDAEVLREGFFEEKGHSHSTVGDRFNQRKAN